MERERVTVRVEELTLTNTLQLTAIVGLLEVRGIMTQGDVFKRGPCVLHQVPYSIATSQ